MHRLTRLTARVGIPVWGLALSPVGAFLIAARFLLWSEGLGTPDRH